MIEIVIGDEDLPYFIEAINLYHQNGELEGLDD